MLANVPNGQLVHVCPVVEYCPGVHARQFPFESLLYPTGQAVHAVGGLVGVCKPQLVHDAALVVLLYLPAGHGVHTDEVLYVPGAHCCATAHVTWHAMSNKSAACIYTLRTQS